MQFIFIAFLGCLVVCMYPGSALSKYELNDNDYYTANADPKMKALLENVENHHLNRTNEYPGGVREQIKKGHYHYALGDLKYTLTKFPNHPIALMLLSIVAQITNTPSLPIQYYEKAIGHFPGYAATHAQYGMYLLQIGLVEKAISRLETAVKIDPKFAAAYATLSEAYKRNGQQELARKAADRARELGYEGKSKIGK